MTRARKKKGLSLAQVVVVVGTDQANLWRVERGAQIPKRELARSLFKFYEGKIPLGSIYDPLFQGPSKAA